MESEEGKIERERERKMRSWMEEQRWLEKLRRHDEVTRRIIMEMEKELERERERQRAREKWGATIIEMRMQLESEIASKPLGYLLGLTLLIKETVSKFNPILERNDLRVENREMTINDRDQVVELVDEILQWFLRLLKRIKERLNGPPLTIFDYPYIDHHRIIKGDCEVNSNYVADSRKVKVE